MRILIFTNNNDVSEKIKEGILNKYPKYNIKIADYYIDVESFKAGNFDVVLLDAFSEEKCMMFALYFQKIHPESKIIMISDDVSAISELMLNIKLFGVIEKPASIKKIHRYLDVIKSTKNETEDRFFIQRRGEKEVFRFPTLYILKARGKNFL